MPAVSVIIPNYNHAAFLRQRIDSVLEQTFQDFEVIILDDCSKDNSKAIIESYRSHPKISHIVYNLENSGSTFRQWKKGIELSEGEWIWIAESDDWAETRFLEELLPFAKDEVSVVYCDSISATADGQTQGIINWARAVEKTHWDTNFVNSGKNEIVNYLFCRNTIPNASAVIVKKVIIENTIRNLPFEFRYAGDWYIWIKCLEGGNLAFVNKPLNYFRQHIQSSRTAKTLHEERKRFKEYFYIINEMRTKYALKLDSSKHHWIIYEWLHKNFSENKITNLLFPPLPGQYYFTYYKGMFMRRLTSRISRK
ncbi:glycosyltransferase family 2 protein [Chryseobacterium sp. SC28]|uniref:glycosyltransferase family 2 protein n=1 Tax=Chryseobacterium sp. SC28 TaxID=2268028 RepID=UPI000F64D822|nr:glycosyltransferase [Chryseobacterium sp. SC28]RRQ45846.1 glycosyltransferase [Chryseobacterium sp. SC28]